MKKILSFIIMLFAIFNISFSATEYFSCGKPNTAFYPLLRAPFTAMSSSGEHYKNFTSKQFNLEENRILIDPANITIDYIDNPPIDVLIVIENRTTMDEMAGSQSKWDWAKAALKDIADAFKYANNSRIGVSIFNSDPKLVLPFTNDKSKIKSCLDNIPRVNSPMDFNSTFITKSESVEQIFSSVPFDHKKIVILITDGRQTTTLEEFKIEEITQKLTNQNINFYGFTYLEKTQYGDLAVLAQNTGGNYELITAPDRLSSTIVKNLESIQKLPLAVINWISKTNCHEIELFKDIKLSFIPITGYKTYFQYKAPTTSVYDIETDLKKYDFGNPPIDEPTERSITLMPTKDVEITNLYIAPSSYFTITDYGNGITYMPTSIKMKAGDKRTIKVVFTQQNKQVQRKATLYIESNVCLFDIELIAGLEQFSMTKPNEGNLFSTCDLIDIEYNGIPNTTNLELKYSQQDNSNWNMIVPNATNGKYSWKHSLTEGFYKIKGMRSYPKEYKWAVSGGGVAKETVNCIDVQENDQSIAICGNYNGTSSIGSHVLFPYGLDDFFIARYDSDGNLDWVKDGGSPSNDAASAVCVDPLGNIYVTGQTYDGIKFENYSIKLPLIERLYTYIVKFSPKGDLLDIKFVMPSDPTEYFESYSRFIAFTYDENNEPIIHIRGKYKGKYYNSEIGTFLDQVKNWTDFTIAYNPRLEIKYITSGLAGPTNGWTSKTKNMPPNTTYKTDNFSDSTTISAWKFKSKGNSDFWISKEAADDPIEDTTGTFEISEPHLTLLYNFFGSDTLGYKSDSSYIDCGKAMMGENSRLFLDSILTNKKIIAADLVSFKLTGDCPTCFDLDPAYLNKTVNTNDVVPIEIIFTPTLFGKCTANLELVLKCGKSLFLKLYGYGECSVETASEIDFNDVQVGNKSSKSLTLGIYNPTINAIKITPTISSDKDHPQHWKDYRLISPKPDSELLLQPFETLPIVVEFTPTAEGERIAYVDWSVGSGCVYNYTVLKGNGTVGKLSANSLNFGKQRINYNFDSDTVIIANNSTKIISVEKILVEGDGLIAFPSGNFPTKFDVPANGIYTIAFDFSPQVDKSYKTSIKFITNDGDTTTADLEGETYLPKLDVETECNGEVIPGEQGEAKITLFNKSTSSVLAVKSITLDNTAEFNFKNGSADNFTIGKNSVKDIELIYTPTENGSHTTNIIIMADNYDGLFEESWKENQYTLSCGSLKFDFSKTEFENSLLCDKSFASIKVKNGSMTTAGLIDIEKSTITGKDSELFSFDTPKKTIEIPINGEANCPLVFSSSTTGKYEAMLNLVTNLETKSFDLKAEAVEITVTADKPTITTELTDINSVNILIDIPQINYRSLDSLEIKLNFNNEALYFVQNSLTMANNSIIWDKPKFNHIDGSYLLKARSGINAPFKDNIATVKFSGSVDTVFNSILNASIIYGKCTTRDHSISNITINEYCRQDSRSFKIKDYNYNFNVIKCDNKTGELEITYSVPFDNSKVILSMVDILGQEINLINDFSNEGEYKKVIDLNSFTSGVYILVYKNSGFTDAKKIYIGK